MSGGLVGGLPQCHHCQLEASSHPAEDLPKTLWKSMQISDSVGTRPRNP